MGTPAISRHPLLVIPGFPTVSIGRRPQENRKWRQWNTRADNYPCGALQQAPPLPTAHITTTTSKSNTHRGGKPKPNLNSIYTSFGGWKKSLLAYGLKHYNNNDVEEGERIAQAMLDNDLEEWGRV